VFGDFYLNTLKDFK